jgi:hypothetical protein
MSSKLKRKSCDLTSCSSSDGDSQEERDDESMALKTNPLKHKTELCKNFSEFGRCPYARKCRFAHGAQELIRTPLRTCFRKKKCNGFWQNGTCSYGVRCQFSHEDRQWEVPAVLIGITGLLHPAPPHTSKLLALLAP